MPPFAIATPIPFWNQAHAWPSCRVYPLPIFHFRSPSTFSRALVLGDFVIALASTLLLFIIREKKKFGVQKSEIVLLTISSVQFSVLKKAFFLWPNY